MVVQFLSARLKANGSGEFTGTLKTDVVPLLRKQRGFRAYDAFVLAEGTEAVGISFWDGGEDLEAYLLRDDLQVMRALGRVTDGTPQIQTHPISKSAFLALEELRSLAHVIERTLRLQIYLVPKATFDKIARCFTAVQDPPALATVDAGSPKPFKQPSLAESFE